MHVLSFVDDPAYRRDIKHMRNLQEGRHSVARHVFHGRKGKLYQAYHAGMEDQLGTLGLVLNCLTLWNTLYLDHAVQALRSQGYQVSEADTARLSAYQYHHLGVHGHYSFACPTSAKSGGGRCATPTQPRPRAIRTCVRERSGFLVNLLRAGATSSRDTAARTWPVRVLGGWPAVRRCWRRRRAPGR